MATDPEPTTGPARDAGIQNPPTPRPPTPTADADENVEPDQLVGEPGDADEIG
jgi:hypothetical protein